MFEEHLQSMTTHDSSSIIGLHCELGFQGIIILLKTFLTALQMVKAVRAVLRL